jgi:hypothetical protein
MKKAQLQALESELIAIKEASFAKNIATFAGRLKPGNIMKGMGEGWDMSSPTGLLKGTTEMGKDFKKVLDTRKSQIAAGAADGATLGDKAKGFLAKNLGAGQWLQPGAKTSQGAQGVAERLSRGGWTGEGRLTKYMPLGQKGGHALYAGMAVPGLVKSMKHGDTGQGGVAEQAGGLAGFTIPGIAGAGLGMTPLVMALGASEAGKYLGRKIDQRNDPQPFERLERDHRSVKSNLMRQTLETVPR